MQLWYLAHPYEGNPESLVRARNWVRSIEAAVEDVAVVAHWIVECQIWDDANQAERAASMARNFAVLARCNAIVLVGGRVSKGMEAERDMAQRTNLTVIDWTPLGKTPIENLADVLMSAWQEPFATRSCRVCNGEPLAPWPPGVGKGPTHHTCYPGEERTGKPNADGCKRINFWLHKPGNDKEER